MRGSEEGGGGGGGELGEGGSGDESHSHPLLEEGPADLESLWWSSAATHNNRSLLSLSKSFYAVFLDLHYQSYVPDAIKLKLIICSLCAQCFCKFEHASFISIEKGVCICVCECL